MKPNNKSTLKEIKQYIIDNKLNQAPIRLTMNKPELVKKLKELGHYEEDADTKSFWVRVNNSAVIRGLEDINDYNRLDRQSCFG